MTVPERALEHVASDDPWINPGPDTPIVGDDLSDLADESSSPQMPRPANFPDPKVEKVITVESNDEYGNGIEEFRGWSVNANGMGLIDTDKVGWCNPELRDVVPRRRRHCGTRRRDQRDR